MSFSADKVMYEIYREAGYNRQYRVVWFTELNEYNKEAEINAALAGEHVYDGFVSGKVRTEAGQAMGALLGRLNAGEVMAVSDIEAYMASYAPNEQLAAPARQD